MSAVGSYLLTDPYLRPSTDLKWLAAEVIKVMGNGVVTLDVLSRLTSADSDLLITVLARLCEDGFTEKVGDGWRLTSWGRRVRYIVA